MFDYGIIEGEIKRASRELAILADPNHITVERLQRHDYPHSIIESNTITFSHSEGSIMAARIPESEYHALARRRGFEFLGPYTGRVKGKNLWRREQGHEWLTCYKYVAEGRGCPVCSGRARIPESDYHMLAEERGLEFIGPYTGRTVDSVTWRCLGCGYEFQNDYGHIRHRGDRCRKCAGLLRKTRKDYEELGKKTGFKWIGSNTPPNSKEQTLWECPEGHTREASYNAVYKETDCPHCWYESINGEGNPNYRGREEDETIRRRDYPEYIAWRDNIFARDDHTCQVCGNAESNTLNAHHIYGYTEHERMRLDPSNGITLCKTCHLEFHHIYGIKHFGALDFLDFISKKGGRIAARNR